MLSITKPSFTSLLVAVAFLGACTPEPPEPSGEVCSLCREGEVTVLWDSWGIPHLYGTSDEDLAYALAYAQMRNHGNLLLELYGKSRGRAAEYWGPDHLRSDTYILTMGLRELAAQQYGQLASEDWSLAEAFAAGLNAYAAERGDELDDAMERALPITGEDVLRHSLHAIYFGGLGFSFRTAEGMVQAFLAGSGQEVSSAEVAPGGASNGWVLGPSRTASGKPIVVSNTHLAWPTMRDFAHSTWFEVQLRSPSLDSYGVGLVGVPALTLGLNGRRAWTVTSSALQVFDFYRVALVDSGYRFDGEVRSFDVNDYVLRVRQSDGRFDEVPLQVRRTVHGPLLADRDETGLAVRVAVPAQFDAKLPWRMARADTLDAFEQAIDDGHAFPPLNVLYGDIEGNILYAHTGAIPDWRQGTHNPSGPQILAGDTSETLWRGLLPGHALPRLRNPSTGYLQNTNEPPWTVTIPNGLDPADFPKDWPGVAPSLRTAASLRMISSAENWTLADAITNKFSTKSEVADRLVDDLVAAAAASGSTEAQQAASVLSSWDRRFDADSEGAVLFAIWAMQIEPSILASGAPFPEAVFALPTDPLRPLETPAGLANPAAAVAALEAATEFTLEAFGTLSAPWGELLRFRIGDADVPAFGAAGQTFGVFNANFGIPQPDGRLAVGLGDTWVSAIDFGDPDAAMAILPYGNASQPGSEHVVDQLPLYAEKKLRPGWRKPEQVLEHLEDTMVLRPGGSAQ